MGTARAIRIDYVEETQPLPAAAAAIARARVEYDWDACLPGRSRTSRWRLEQAVKRGLDVVLAAVLLVLLLPVLVLVALLVKLTSPGPLFFRWSAVGERARPFVTYKFRTMVPGADGMKGTLLHMNEMRGPVFKIREDPRVTPVGRWLRKYSVDELPQLWSVLKGDMSLVGPRPPFPDEFASFEEWQWAKMAVRPGITCIWQVSGRSEISDFREWVRLDLNYIEHWNLLLDLEILLRTVPAVIGARGAY